MKSAVFTIVQHEPVFFPIWRDYYLRHFAPEDIYVLNHTLPKPRNNNEHVVKDTWEDWLHADRELHGYNVVQVSNDLSFQHDWLRDQMMAQQVRLHERYDATLLTEVDEIVTPDPAGPYGSSLDSYIRGEMPGRKVRTCWGYEVVHKYDEEPAINPWQPLLRQRGWWYSSTMYSKPILCTEPQRYCRGFHTCENVPLSHRFRDPALILLHLHKIDLGICQSRNEDNASRRWSEGEDMGSQNRIVSLDRLKSWWWIDVDQSTARSDLIMIPDRFKDIL